MSKQRPCKKCRARTRKLGAWMSRIEEVEAPSGLLHYAWKSDGLTLCGHQSNNWPSKSGGGNG